MGHKYALIVIDMLEDFVYGPLKNPRAKTIIPRIKKLLHHARKNGWLVIFSNDAHHPGDPEEKVWGPHAMAGTKGAQVIQDLMPEKGDFQVPKRSYSGFYETPLDSILGKNKITHVVITGQHTHICVRHTSADAFARQYSIIIPKDAVESFSEKDHQAGLEYLKMCYGAKIISTKALMK